MEAGKDDGQQQYGCLAAWLLGLSPISSLGGPLHNPWRLNGFITSLKDD